MEEKLPDGLAKAYMLNLKRFVKLLTNQLKWYGVPYEFKRLPSTKMPNIRKQTKNNYLAG